MTGLLLIGSYILGSLPTGFLVIRLLRGEDIRKLGSGNIGTANVWRAGGPLLAILVLLADLSKGALPVLLSRSMGLAELWVVAAAIVAIAGHNWSIFLRFRGGKGVATTLGVMIALAPPAALIGFGIWLIVVGITRYSSLGSMTAALSMPISLRLFQYPLEDQVFALVAALLVIYMHRSNIQRLLRGKELRLSSKKELKQ